jgi:hypothetical protein
MRATLLLLLAACGGSAPPSRGPVEPAKPAPESPKDQSGGLGCVEPCELTKPEEPDAPLRPAPPAGPTVWERITVTTGPVAGFTAYSIELVDSAAYCGGKQLVTKRDAKVKIAKADQPLADVFALEFPLGLDFTPDSDAARASTKTFQDWLEKYQQAYVAAQAHYETDLAVQDPGVQVAAAARLHQLAHRFATVLAYVEIPRGLSGDDAKLAYCEVVGEYASQMLERADEAKAACTEKAKSVSVRKSLWWQSICQ